MPTAIAPSTDYSSPDFDALEARMENLLSGVFPNWTDRNRANFGNAIRDLFCYVGDVNSKYINNAALNSRWSTAWLRSAIVAACGLIGYVPQGQTASAVIETFTLSAEAEGTVTLPAGTLVSTLDPTGPISYQLLDPLVFAVGQTTATATVTNSLSQTDTFDATGLLNQTCQATRAPYLQGTQTVTAAQGLFAQVPNFLNSEPADLVYTVAVDASGNATFTFGDGVNGALPQGAIAITYQYGGGTAGEVQPASLVSLPGSFTDSLGNPVSISVTNALASSPAQDMQSVASIKQLAPLSIRPAGRAIARNDYQDVALQVPGVARALMLFRGQDPSVMVNQGVLRIVPPSAGAPSAQLLAAVTQAFVTTPYSMTLNLLIVQASYCVVNIQVSANKSTGVTGPQLKAAILAALGAWFSPLVPALDLYGNPSVDKQGNPTAGAANPLVDFGYNLQDENGSPTGVIDWSDLFDAIRNAPVPPLDANGNPYPNAGAPAVRRIPPVNGLQLNGATQDVPIAVSQFPQLGTVTVIDADTDTVL